PSSLCLLTTIALDREKEQPPGETWLRLCLLLWFFLFLTLSALFFPTNAEDIVQQVFLFLLHLLAICIPFDWHLGSPTFSVSCRLVNIGTKNLWCCIARYISNGRRRSSIKWRYKQVLEQSLASIRIGANSRPQFAQLISGN